MTKKFFLKKKYKILFIQPIQAFSGSLKSSEEYIKNLRNKFNFIFLTQKGFSSKILKNYGKVFVSYGICKFDNTQNSHYVGFRWILIIREFFYLFFSIFNLLKIKYFIKGIDVIHLNEFTGLPTAIIAKLIFNKPLIVHVRSLNYKDNKSVVSNLYLKILQKFADKIIAIDKDVLETVNIKNKSIILRNILDIKYNHFKKFKKKKNILKIGYIGTLVKYKGIEVLIKAVKELILKGYRIELTIAGSFIKRNFFIKKIIQYLKIDNNIDEKLLENKFIKNLGFVKNIEKFYKKIDLLCFPSSLNATGRQIFEAGIFSIPVIVCLKRNKSDGITHKYNGLIYSNFFSTRQLQEKILFFYNNRKQIKIMGNNGRKIAIKRNIKKKNIERLNSIYMEQIKYIN